MVTDQLVNNFKEIGDRLNEYRKPKPDTVSVPQSPQPVDEDMEKWRKFIFKMLVILVGGLAAVLIVVRIVLKFI